MKKCLKLIVVGVMVVMVSKYVWAQIPTSTEPLTIAVSPPAGTQIISGSSFQVLCLAI